MIKQYLYNRVATWWRKKSIGALHILGCKKGYVEPIRQNLLKKGGENDWARESEFNFEVISKKA